MKISLKQKMFKKSVTIKVKLFLLYATYCILPTVLTGCATIPTQEALPSYQINGITYLAAAPLCQRRGLNWEYDTFTKTMSLSKDAHKINLVAGDNLVLIDGRAMLLKHPVDIYQGTVVVPYEFKEEILDPLFKESYTSVPRGVPFSKIKRVVIDAGHGGTDPGAIGRTGLREKDVTLDIAKRISSIISSYGIEVVMTRSIDRFVPLSSRTKIANDSCADLFISIHANANRVRSLNGVEMYYVSPSVSDSSRALDAAQEAALRLNNAQFGYLSRNLKAILWDMVYTNSRAESIELARSMRKAIDKNLDAKFLKIQGARYYVLKGARMPAVLVEVGFLSNSYEERMLRNNYYRQRVAEAIAEGLRDYARDCEFMQAQKQ